MYNPKREIHIYNTQNVTQQSYFVFETKLFYPRIYSATYNLEGIIFAGGYPLGSNASKTMEFVNFDEHVDPISNLPIPTRSHCLAYGNNYETHSLWIIGGHSGESEEKGRVSNQTFFYYIHENRWYNGSPLAISREFHTCSEIRFGSQYGETAIIVTGGRDENGQALDSVEILTEDYGTWIQGPKLPKPLFGHAMVYLEERSSVIVIGGNDGQNASSELYEMTCRRSPFGLNCEEWITMEQKLLEPRYGLVATIVTDQRALKGIKPT